MFAKQTPRHCSDAAVLAKKPNLYIYSEWVALEKIEIFSPADFDRLKNWKAITIPEGMSFTTRLSVRVLQRKSSIRLKKQNFQMAREL